MSPDVILTPSQITQYHREGYLVLPPLSDPEEIARLRGIYDHHFAVRSGREEGAQFDLFGNDADPARPNVPQILGLSRFAPEVKETRLYANVRSALAQLFGQECDQFGDHAIQKPPFCPMATPWHQDEAYWDGRLDHFSASVWVPLQEVDERNGCMYFVPRSHWEELLAHRTAGNDPSVHGLELDGEFPDLLGQAVSCPLAAGGCTIHHQRLLHYTSPNGSAAPRRAWIFVGGIKTRKRIVARHLPWEAGKHTAREARALAFKQRKVVESAVK